MLDRLSQHPKNPERVWETVANAPFPPRTESRIPKRILVRLSNPEKGRLEITHTVDISCHGAQVVSRRFFQPSEQLLVQSVRGSLYSRARVAHYRSLTQDSYLLGLHLYDPTQDWTASGSFQKLSGTAKASLKKRSVHPHEVLKELHSLLEEYRPMWYAEKQRERDLAALRLPTPPEALLELVSLLEEYAPTWYSEKQRDRALAALQVLSLVE